MQRPCLKPAIIGGLLFFAILLSGCGALRFTYNRASYLTYWWLDGFVDFNRDQDARVRGAIDTFFRWHRSTQLPDYAELLARARVEVQAPATPTQACRWYDEVQGRLQPMVQQGLPLMLETAQSITAQQFLRMERKYGKRNADFVDDYLQADPAERFEASVKRAIERVESLYGWLDALQKDEVERMVANSPFDPALWLAERKARQHDTLQTLRRLSSERLPRDDALTILLTLAERMQNSPRLPYREYQQRLQRYNCEFAARLHNSTSRKQRMKAVEKLKGWEDDLRALGRGS